MLSWYLSIHKSWPFCICGNYWPFYIYGRSLPMFPNNLMSKYLPSGHSKKIYMCYIHYYNWDCLVFFFPAPTPISSKWAEYVLFASLLLAVCIIFAIMARFYTYINPAEIEAQFDQDEKKKKPENIYAEIDPASQTLQTKMWMSGSQWRMNWAQSVPWLVSPGGRTPLDGP